jgi:hypothetical protein
MRAVAILLIALVLGSNASLVTKYPIEYSNRRSIMSVMVEVESKIKSGGPLDTVNGVLNEFKAAVNEE